MNFEAGKFADIKSISQRGLALYWDELCGDRAFPCFDEFNPGPRRHDPNQLVIWRVEGTATRPTFRALYQGLFVAEAVNSSLAGKTLDEVTPPPLRPGFTGGSQECVRSGCPIYMTLRTYDPNQRAIDLERLLLPFGREGIVEQIVASLQLVSLAGTFDRKTVASTFEASCSVNIAVRIPRTMRAQG